MLQLVETTSDNFDYNDDVRLGQGARKQMISQMLIAIVCAEAHLLLRRVLGSPAFVWQSAGSYSKSARGAKGQPQCPGIVP
jgi:hypothetical protein